LVLLISLFNDILQHLLRDEEGVYYEDLYPLLSFLPRHANEPKGDNIDEVEKLPLWHISEAHIDTTEPRRRNLRSEDTTRGSDINEKTLTNKSAANVQVGSDSGSIATVPLRNGHYSLPARSKTFDPEAALPRIESRHPLMPARNPPALTMYDHFPILRLFRWIGRIFTGKFRHQTEESAPKKRKPYSKMVEGPIPLEIILVLSK
jgi:putative membrane protein